MKSKLTLLLFILTLVLSCVEDHSPRTIDISKNWHFSPDKNNTGIYEKWYAVSFDDSQWRILDTGKRWEDQGYPNLDSYGWYRKKVAIPADWEGKDVWLKFGGVNDSYELFINGERVSSFGERNSSVAGRPTVTMLAERLNYGESNQITVKVNDWGLSGGLWRLPIIITTDENNVSNVPTQTITVGDLLAVFVDNSEYGEQHHGGYNGISELRHSAQDSSLFVPSFAGFNLEHIFSGDSLSFLYEPRDFPMELKKISKNSVELHQAETSLSHVESWTTFKLIAPHYIDINFRCIIKSDDFFRHGYAGFFWASYINAPHDKKIYFLGKEKETSEQKWIGARSSKHGVASTHTGINDNFNLFTVPGFNVSLANHYSNHVFTKSFYYGRFENMVFVYLFSKPKDGIIRFTQSPTGAGPQNPAWDFQFIISDFIVGKEYSFKVRLVYKEWVDAENILKEYEDWINKNKD